jgi:hypothetical protein
MIPAGYHRKNGAGLSTQHFQGGWLEQNWVHTPHSNNTLDSIDFKIVTSITRIHLVIIVQRRFLVTSQGLAGVHPFHFLLKWRMRGME